MRKYTVVEYDKEDYDAAENNMTLSEVADALAYVKRGYVGDYDFSGEEDDFERFKLHIAISKAIDIIREKADKEDDNNGINNR